MPIRLPFDLSGDFATELQELLASNSFQSVVIWFRGGQQKFFACTRPISDNGAWISRQYRLVPLLEDFRDDGHEVQLEFVPFGSITWELHQERYPVPVAPEPETANSNGADLTATEPDSDPPATEKAISPKDEVSEQNAPSVISELQTQNVFGNPPITMSGASEVVLPLFDPAFDPAVVIKESRGGRPRKWNSDAERMAYNRALRAKKPVTVQTLVADLEKAPSRNVNPSLLKQRVEEQQNKCLLCETAFGTFVTNGKRTDQLRPSPDHFEPYSLRRNNEPENIFAVDQICNSMKRDWVFKSLNEARTWMKDRWDEQGWREGFTFLSFRGDVSMFSQN